MVWQRIRIILIGSLFVLSCVSRKYKNCWTAKSTKLLYAQDIKDTYREGQFGFQFNTSMSAMNKQIKS